MAFGIEIVQRKEETRHWSRSSSGWLAHRHVVDVASDIEVTGESGVNEVRSEVSHVSRHRLNGYRCESG